VVLKLPILAAGVGFASATAALWVQRWQREDHRVFAGLISISVTLTLFSGVAWGATEIAEGTPLSFLLVGYLLAHSLYSSRGDCIANCRTHRRAKLAELLRF
jgi:hypothetical protein